jgi:hypothetical protein
LPEGIVVLKEIAALAKKLSGLDVTITTSIGGNLSDVSLAYQVESLAVYDEKLAQIYAHPELPPLVARLAAIALPNSGHERLYRHV